MSEHRPEAQCVLVVDDDQGNRGFLVRGLGYEGYRVVEAGGGPEGLELARRERPDVILLDIMMPSLDGFGVVEALRAGGVDSPVVFVSARDEREVRAQAEGLGVPLLVKPVLFEDLLAELRRAIAGASRPTGRPPAPRDPSAPAKPGGPS